MERLRIPLAPFVIGFVLSPLAEENLGAGLMLSDGSLLPIVTRPLSLLFFSVAVVMGVVPVWRRFARRRRVDDNEPGSPKLFDTMGGRVSSEADGPD